MVKGSCNWQGSDPTTRGHWEPYSFFTCC